jgi:hypothetical protein
MVLMNRGLIPSDSVINNFITNVRGTYAQIIAETGPLTGIYVVSIQTSG